MHNNIHASVQVAANGEIIHNLRHWLHSLDKLDVVGGDHAFVTGPLDNAVHPAFIDHLVQKDVVVLEKTHLVIVLSIVVVHSYVNRTLQFAQRHDIIKPYSDSVMPTETTAHSNPLLAAWCHVLKDMHCHTKRVCHLQNLLTYMHISIWMLSLLVLYVRQPDAIYQLQELSYVLAGTPISGVTQNSTVIPDVVKNIP